MTAARAISNTNNVAARFLCQLPRAQARYCYLDKLQIWLRTPLSAKQMRQIDRHCAVSYVENGDCWWDWHYTQKVQICRPDVSALRTLAALDDTAILNYIEIAVDFILRDEIEVDHWLDTFKNGFLHRWHDRRMCVEAYSGGFSTRASPERGESRRGRWFNYYADKPCRITGEVHCFHFEGKHCGVQFLRRIGIHHPRDLLDFDFDSYFIKNLQIYDLDFERLGRYHDNKQSGAKRKKGRIIEYGKRGIYNQDARLGGILYQALAVHSHQHERSLQCFVDNYGRGPFLSPVHSYDHVHEFLTSENISYPYQRNC
jgi:hypothetical protein